MNTTFCYCQNCIERIFIHCENLLACFLELVPCPILAVQLIRLLMNIYITVFDWNSDGVHHLIVYLLHLPSINLIICFCLPGDSICRVYLAWYVADFHIITLQNTHPFPDPTVYIGLVRHMT